MNPKVKPFQRTKPIPRIARVPLMIAAAVVLLAGCGVDRGEKNVHPQNTGTAAPADPAAGTYVLGSSVTDEGAIADGTATEAFLRGGPVFLSIDVAGATTDQTIEIEWIGPRGRVFRRDRRLVRQGARYAAFSVDSTARWVPGTYRVVVIIDHRLVNEQSFSLIGNAVADHGSDERLAAANSVL
jgi:hypothetical protein